MPLDQAASCNLATSCTTHPRARSLRPQTWEGWPTGCRETALGGGARASAGVANTRDGARIRKFLLGMGGVLSIRSREQF